MKDENVGLLQSFEFLLLKTFTFKMFEMSVITSIPQKESPTVCSFDQSFAGILFILTTRSCFYFTLC